MTMLMWILGTLAKSTVLLLVAVVVAVGLRRGSAAWRHLVWATAITGVLILPLAPLVMPWRLSIIPVPVGTNPIVRSDVGVTPVAPDLTGPDATAPTAVPDAPRSASSQAAPPAEPGMPWFTILLAVWAAGALVLLGRLLVGALVLRRVLRRAEHLDVADWRRRLLEGADRLALSRLPALVMSDRLPMPFACGILRPAIVLPAEAGAWSDRRRQAVLFHELAHLSRHDLWLNALGQMACAVYWFHPLVWVAVRKLRVESERACDDLVLGVGTRPSEYADHLLQIVCRAARAHTPAVALPMAQRHEFEGRMLAILERSARREPASGRHAAGVAAFALALVLPLAALAPGIPTPPTVPAAGPSQAVPAARETTAFTVPRVTAPVVEEHRTAPSPSPVPMEGVSDTAVVAALVRALGDTVADVREDAAYALGRLEAHAAVAALGTRVARDPAPKVREMAAWALGRIESREGSAALVAAAQHDAAEAVRTMAVWALGHVGDPATVPGLAGLLHESSAELRGRAIWALGTIAPPTAPAGLRDALRDPSSEVRIRAAWALGRIGDTTAVPALSAALRDSTATVRRAALWALGRIGGDAAQSALLRALVDPDPEVRTRAVRALAGSHLDPWPWPWPMPMIR